MKFKGSFGDWLKERRKALDLTQRDLAEQVSCAEVTIRKIEGDVSRPSKQIAERMADVLAIAPDEHAAFVSFARRLADTPPAVPVDLASSLPAYNLPPQFTPFVGRETELAQIADHLADPSCRLLTLVGPGGIGKTRLALQAAADRLEDYADGVYFVSLTPVGSATLIAEAIASALQISFYGQDDPDVQVVNYLRGKHLLLLMDNYEHLLDGVGLLTDTLTNAPRVKILVTSRERLNIQEEWALPIEGLPFPAQETNDEVESYSAVQLFVQSARRVRPGFSLEGNQSALIDICRAVEGMPLGIELAATWLRAMPCQQIAGQIRRDLDFLATPLRNVPERHRSLRAVFEHSWGLLSPAERGVMMKLSVFHGGCDVEAAEQVAGATLPILAGLVDKSLIRLNSAGRYDLHELVRQYAASRLQDAGEENTTHQGHCDYFLKLAEGAEAHVFGREQVAWFDRAEIELDNLRAAFAWSVEAETGLRLAAALGWFFSERHHWDEGCTWLERALAANQTAPDSLRAKALHSAAALSGPRGDKQRTQTLCEQALALARATNDRWNIAWSLSHLALFVYLDDREPPQAGEALLDESLALFRELDDPMGIAHTLIRRGFYALDAKDYPYVRLLMEEAATRAQEAGDKIVMAWATYDLGRLAWFQDHDLPQARTCFEKSAALFREARCPFTQPQDLLADLERTMGNVRRAQTYYEDQLISPWANTRNNSSYAAFILAGLASVATVRGLFERAARLLGATESILLARSGRLDEGLNMTYYDDVAAVRAQLGESAYAEAWAAGKAMTQEQAIAYALEERMGSTI